MPAKIKINKGNLDVFTRPPLLSLTFGKKIRRTYKALRDDVLVSVNVERPEVR